MADPPDQEMIGLIYILWLVIPYSKSTLEDSINETGYWVSRGFRVWSWPRNHMLIHTTGIKPRQRE